MNLCWKHQDEICFEGKECPLCLCIAEIKDLNERIDGLIEERDNHECGS